MAIWDHDHPGFAFSRFYDILEVPKDGEWEQITTMNESQATDQEVYAIPQTDQDHSHLTSEVCMNSLLPADTQLQPGHYRVTRF